MSTQATSSEPKLIPAGKRQDDTAHLADSERKGKEELDQKRMDQVQSTGLTAVQLLWRYIGEGASFREGQHETISAIMDPKVAPVLSIMGTGQGKTLCIAISSELKLQELNQERNAAMLKSPTSHQPRPCNFVISPQTALMREHTGDWIRKHPGSKAVLPQTPRS